MGGLWKERNKNQKKESVPTYPPLRVSQTDRLGLGHYPGQEPTEMQGVKGSQVSSPLPLMSPALGSKQHQGSAGVGSNFTSPSRFTEDMNQTPGMSPGGLCHLLRALDSGSHPS